MHMTSNQLLDQAHPIDGRALRSICGLFVTGVTVITSGVDSEAAGTTVNSFTSVSLDPPLVLFCLHRNSRLNTVVQESQAFVVNFLAAHQKTLAWAFAGKTSEHLHGAAHHPSAAGAPILSDALAFLACRLVNEFDGGDHIIYVGHVLELGAPRRHREPLVFFRGLLGALEDQLHIPHPIIDG
jgi:flavin reductase (DIM6/NTAB) family NADH-FMN oxidoreductase RutF